jgi:carbamoyltransferase
MLILGLCVAHDAGVALIDSGRVVGLVQRERWDRRKRSALITPDFLEHALTQLGVTWNEIDVVAIATCQSWPFLFTEPARFRFSVSSDAAARLPVNVIGLAEATRQAEGALKQLEDLKAHRVNQIKDGLYSEYIGVDISGLDPHASADRCVEWTSYRARWLDTSPKRPSIQAAVADTLSREHQPIGYLSADVTFDGVTKPGLLVPHHLAHAAYGFYQSGEERSAIATLDNGDVMGALNGYVGGILAFGSGAKLSVIDFRFAFEGHLYQRVGEFVGLGQPSGVAGKLMGLAPYGDITYFNEGLVGDAIRLYGEDYAHGRKNERFHVLQPLANRLAAVEGSVPDAPLDGIDRDANGAINLTRLKTRLAATAQAVMEENTLATLRSLHDGFVRAGASLDAVVLSGGTALNCPANTRAARETPFDRVRVAPAVDDSGLPIGAAQAVAHDLLGLKRPDVDPNSAALAYLGAQYDEAAVERALATAGNAVRVIDTGNAALAAARDLAGDRVIAWFEGRSEIGPRALG